MNEYRTIRNRQISGQQTADRSRPASLDGAARFVGQVYNGGMMGDQPGLFYLTNPVQFNGPEQEGGGYIPVVDTTTSVPVLFLSTVPAVGDLAVATAVGGRWVAEDTGTPAKGCNVPCSPCAIWQKDLQIAWVNPLTGNGSATLVYSSGTWTANCMGGGGNQISFKLWCNNGQVELRVIYYVSGSCPTGQSEYCSNLNGGLTYNERFSTCQPLNLVYQLTSETCPALSASGYETFAVSDPDPTMPPAGCGCLWWCDSYPAPKTLAVTLTGNGVSFGPFLMPGGPDGTDPPHCTWAVNTVVDFPGGGSCPATKVELLLRASLTESGPQFVIAMGIGFQDPIFSGCNSSFQDGNAPCLPAPGDRPGTVRSAVTAWSGETTSFPIRATLQRDSRDTNL